jgi:hypothetical protein
MLFDGWHDDYRTVSWSAAPTTSFATCDVILGAHADATPAVSIESVASAIDVVNEWDELTDTLNLSHGMVVTSVFTIGMPHDSRSDNEMTSRDGSTRDRCGEERFQDFQSVYCGSCVYIWPPRPSLSGVSKFWEFV